jgi:hypothetical protein
VAAGPAQRAGDVGTEGLMAIPNPGHGADPSFAQAHQRPPRCTRQPRSRRRASLRIGRLARSHLSNRRCPSGRVVCHARDHAAGGAVAIAFNDSPQLGPELLRRRGDDAGWRPRASARPRSRGSLLRHSRRHSRPRSKAVIGPLRAVHLEPRTYRFEGRSGQNHTSEAGFESR